MDTQTAYSVYDDEREINLVSLLFGIARRYRLIIAAAVICTVLAGGFSLFKDWRTQKAIESGAETSTSDQEDYEAALAEYHEAVTTHNNELANYKDQLAANEESQKDAEESIARAEEYIDKSLLNRIDPYKVHTASADLYIATDYQIIPSMSYQSKDYTDAVVSVYYNRLTSGDTMSNIAGKYNTEETYLRELVTVTRTEGASLISISVRAKSSTTANDILDELLDVVDSSKETINSTVGSHTVNVLSRTDSVTVSTDLRDSQQANSDNLATLRESLETLKAEHDSLEQNIKSTQATIDALSEPAVPEVGHSLVKFAVIGFVLGVFLSAGYVAVRFLIVGRVHSAADLKDTCRLPILGALAGEATRKAKGIDAWLNRLEGRASPAADDEMLRLIAATIHSRAPQAKTVLVTGDISAERLAALAAGLEASGEANGHKLAACESVLKSAATVTQAAAADAIVLVADCSVSTYNSVNLQTEQLASLGKSILGCVVYE